MNLKRALFFSLVFHGIVFGVLLSGVTIPWPKTVSNPIPIQARLVVKKQRDKDLLPKKQNLVTPLQEEGVKEEDKPKVEEKPQEIPIKKEVADKEKVAALKRLESAAPAPKIGKEKVAAKDSKAPSSAKKPVKDFAKQLASITKSFAKDFEKEQQEVFTPDGEVADDATYFDQVYALIKGSFVVPPHIDGPAGHKLQTVVRIFLASDGTLTNLELESSSGDEHFDKAVIDGTRRINNFGAVPIFLQAALRERGIVVELCPFKCANS